MNIWDEESLASATNFLHVVKSWYCWSFWQNSVLLDQKIQKHKQKNLFFIINIYVNKAIYSQNAFQREVSRKEYFKTKGIGSFNAYYFLFCLTGCMFFLLHRLSSVFYTETVWMHELFSYLFNKILINIFQKISVLKRRGEELSVCRKPKWWLLWSSLITWGIHELFMLTKIIPF